MVIVDKFLQVKLNAIEARFFGRTRLFEIEQPIEKRNSESLDPRQDFQEDSELWNTLIRFASRNDSLQQLLIEFRKRGTKIVDYRLQPVIGDGCWQSKEEYMQQRNKLEPYSATLVKLLKELKTYAKRMDLAAN